MKTKTLAFNFLILMILFFIGVTPVHAKNLYVRPNGGSYGTEDGTSWTNAFDGFSDIAWNSVSPGDIIYVGTGNYTQSLTVGTSGNSSSRIVIRAAQDTYTGIANLNGGISYNGSDYVTIDGGYNGNRNFTTTYVSGQNTIDPGLHYITINGGAADFRFSSKGEISYNYSTLAANEDCAFNFEASLNSNSFGQTRFHHNTIIVPGSVNDGIGADGLKPGIGMDAYNNIFKSVVGTVSNSEHQDLIQIWGNNFCRIFNNEFIDSGDSQLGIATGGSGLSNIHIYNNVFRRTIDQMGTVMLRLYSTSTLTTFTNIIIENNTFVDGARTYDWYGGAIRIQAATSASATASSMRNNLVYNCGDGWDAILWEGSASGWVISNNLINAGSEGNAKISGLSNSNGQAGVPQFVAYIPYSLSNNLHLAATDVAAKDKGTSVSAFSTDKDGIARPQGSAFDIGAYEAGGSTDTQAPSVPANLISPVITQTGFTLSWTASTDNTAVTGYEVFRGTTSCGTTASTTLNINGLTCNTTYSMTVKARDAAGNWSAASAAKSVTTAACIEDTQAPTAPTNLSTFVVTQNSFTLSWAPSTDNVGVVSYEVFRGTSSCGTTTGTSLNITGLVAGTTYTMTVKAKDAAGNVSSASTVLNVTTSAMGTATSIWSSYDTPVTAADPDASPVEVGVKFKSDIAGYITGIRFYKGTGNTGIHIGNLWTSTGTKLATVTFTGETASGWQQANLSNPVAITAGTMYVASYYAPSGHYSGDNNGLLNGKDNSPLNAIANSVSPNGVYLYANGGGFPTQSYQASNYWVDIVFSAATPAYTLTVNSGTGSGAYTTGKVVNITANTPAAGKLFDKWTGTTTGIANVNSASTTITMSPANTTITASYKDITYTVTFSITDGTKPIAGASVTYNKQTLLSDVNGLVVFYNVPLSTGLVYTISASGFKTNVVNINVVNNVTKEVILSTNSLATDDDNTGIRIYPNPVTSILYISEIKNRSEVFIYDINGKLIFQKQVTGDLMIDVSGFASGLYNIRIIGDHKTYNYKLIKD